MHKEVASNFMHIILILLSLKSSVIFRWKHDVNSGYARSRVFPRKLIVPNATVQPRGWSSDFAHRKYWWKWRTYWTRTCLRRKMLVPFQLASVQATLLMREMLVPFQLASVQTTLVYSRGSEEEDVSSISVCGGHVICWVRGGFFRAFLTTLTRL